MEPSKKQLREIREHSIGLLARREYAAAELRQRLMAKGYPPEQTARVLAELQAEGLQDDGRYVESYIRSRANKGYGPVRLRLELAERRLDDSLVSEALSRCETNWFELARQVRKKRFGDQVPGDFAQRVKQQRFLHYRGFDSAQIAAALGQNEFE